MSDLTGASGHGDVATIGSRSPVSLFDVSAAAGTARPGRRDIFVTGVSLDSRDVRPGDLFAGLTGEHAHGAYSSVAALASGAVAVLTDARGAATARASGLPVIIVPDPRAVLGRICAQVYGTAESPMTLFGVTGTNGKTTTASVIHAVLSAAGIRTGLSSTLERNIAGVVSSSDLTTPEAPALHALLARMRDRDVRSAAIEVSAQSITAHRIDGIPFDVVGFTNLTHDHLDQYANMDAYLGAKAALFTPHHARRGVVSLDSPAGHRIAAQSRIPFVTIATATAGSRAPVAADWMIDILEEHLASTRFRLTGPRGSTFETAVSLTGRHMATDAALALVMLIESGLPPAVISDAMDTAGMQLRLPGRSELVSSTSAGPRVYLDIAHTPDAIEHTARAIRRMTTGRLIMLVGADGDRDSSKRPAMGAAAASIADVVVITDHHSRFEDPAQIRAGLLGGAHQVASAAEVVEIASPAAAIRYAISRACESDAVLWTGPGRTAYQDVQGMRIPYSPSDDAQLALMQAGWLGPGSSTSNR